MVLETYQTKNGNGIKDTMRIRIEIFFERPIIHSDKLFFELVCALNKFKVAKYRLDSCTARQIDQDKLVVFNLQCNCI